MRIVTSGLLILAMGRPLGAQQPVVVEAGIAAAHFPVDNVSAGGPYLRLTTAGVHGNAFGSLDAGAIASFGGSSGFGSLRAGMSSSRGAGWSAVLDGELAAVAGTNHNGAAGTGILAARSMWTAVDWGAWLRASGHLSERTNSTPNGGSLDVTAWHGIPGGQLSASVTQEWTRAELYTGTFRSGFVGTVPVRYTEGALALNVARDWQSYDVSAVLRRDPDADLLWEGALNVTGVFWVKDRMALVVSGGRQLPDWVRGADEAVSFSIGLRFRQSSPVLLVGERILPIVQVPDSTTRVLRVRAAGASTVDLMGDFTEWEAKALSRSGDTFTLSQPVTAGSHRLLLRINGGPWRAAVNTPVVDDDLGGKVGLLVVP